MYTVIGDVVRSRKVHDRKLLYERLDDALGRAGRVVPGVQPLEPTVGDEFQGAYSDIGSATRVGLLVRLMLLPEFDVRCGIGQGEASVFDANRRPLLQDGPAWWAARQAIEKMAEPRSSKVRAWYVGDDSDRVNAFLLCRDALVDRLTDRSRRTLLHALQGATQREIAETEGITESAVSQQFARGVAAVRDAQDLLSRSRPDERLTFSARTRSAHP
jgi:hypothetical protein